MFKNRFIDPILTGKIRLLAFIFLIAPFGIALGQDLNEGDIAHIREVTFSFKRKDINKICGLIEYPLKRQYPIPSIKNPTEMKQRFGEVFDPILVKQLAHSEIRQWSKMGWRGIMFESGLVWIEEFEGKITGVNYQSDAEKKLRIDLIAREKNQLHASVREFNEPWCKIQTSDHFVRIDILEDDQYRYAAWKIGRDCSSQPDLVLENGVFEYQGSGGNYQITFVQDGITYRLFRNLMGEYGSPDFSIVVERDGQTVTTTEGMTAE